MGFFKDTNDRYNDTASRSRIIRRNKSVWSDPDAFSDERERQAYVYGTQEKEKPIQTGPVYKCSKKPPEVCANSKLFSDGVDALRSMGYTELQARDLITAVMINNTYDDLERLILDVFKYHA